MLELLTVRQLAKTLHCSEGTIYNRLSQGKDMPPSVQIGRRRLFPLDEFKYWMKQHSTAHHQICLIPKNGGSRDEKA
jgi:excisionase family DNA binding protein